MNHLKRTLLLGTGPASVQLAVTLKTFLGCEIGIAGRKSVRSAAFFEALMGNDRHIYAEIQNEKHRQMQGDCTVDQVFQGISTIKGEWDTIILSVTTDAYIEVLKQVPQDVLKRVESIILLSPTFGSNSLVKSFLSSVNPLVEIISFSTYLGDTRWKQGHPSNQVVTTGLKKKLYIGSTNPSSQCLNNLKMLFKQLNILLEIMSTPIEAESRNISLYVHPPLFMNEFSLSAIFGETEAKKYVYKLYPEGPITPSLIRDMLAMWREMMSILHKLTINGLNLLKFMIDDNYPVSKESLSRADIEQFTELEPIHQEYLLYIRYSALLIDPFSTPDENGRYYDFSGVPFQKLFVNRDALLDIPRMPKEDYYRLKIIQGIARGQDLSCPTIDNFIRIYERKIISTAKFHPKERLSPAFTVLNLDEDLQMINSELRSRNA
ncbi:opine metallophore biosynthesis dehydrogenase [Jeotgalibacillus proteolyticus]|uniref:DUF2338 domain-containing protein n=1 Tax=Jeotgalibacillus proteolyticus TaxID=2082395 RepID=A0A2S5GBI9_9BACL|nr:opine metallophore biosynthesis dehydrogenase [Jeotgalibacillus proteolyticus]PPA70392.1 DUF2338 domain-containing protein [Jeotgalibacillus proteolyticus]